MKTMTKVALASIVIFSTSSVFATVNFTTPAKINNMFKNTINSIISDSNNIDEYYYNNEKAWKIYYNSNVDSLLEPYGTAGNVNGYLSLTTDWDYRKLVGFGKQPYQCVGFVKAGTTLDDEYDGIANFWTQGQKLSTSYRPSSGTVIATFQSDGSYDGVYNHTAIYVSGNSSYIYLLDQAGSAGYITIRAIPFSGSGNANASNYYVVEH